MSRFLLFLLATFSLGLSAGAQIVVSAPGRTEGAGPSLLLGVAEAGVIKDIPVEEGDFVEKDAVLARLDCSTLDAEIEQRTAELAMANAAFERIGNGPRAEEIRMAEANVAAAKARSVESRAALERISTLKEAHWSTHVQMLLAQRDDATNTAALDAARAQLDLMRAGSRVEDVAEAQARRSAAQASLALATARRRQCEIRSPVSGVVTRKIGTIGQFVSPTIPTPVIALADLSSRNIRAEVDERDLANICEGQNAVVIADGFPGEEVHGRVSKLLPAMGRRSVLSGDAAEKSDKDVREVLVAFSASEHRQWPLGLRVVVKFSRCKAEK
jgi:multidrug resistance efflux pump